MSRARPLAMAAAMALVAAACSAGVAAPTTTTATTTTATTIANAGGSVTLVSGTAKVEAAQSFDDSGFHKVISVAGTVPNLDPAAGASQPTLEVSLWDASRPDQTCNQDHPLSGCLTIDWSDSPGRPHVPESGVFNNQIAFVSANGTVALHLSESGSLAVVPDQFVPG